MLDTLLYICSDDRSGSTMLELALSNHSSICAAGEVHNLPAYVHNSRIFFDPPYQLKCTCGEEIDKCTFWGEVDRHLNKRIKDLYLREELLGTNGVLSIISSIYRNIHFKRRRRRSGIFKYKAIQSLLGYKIIAKHYFELYSAISNASNANVVIDSSKWPYRFSYLYNFFPYKVKVILLYREPAGVVYSKYKRNQSSIKNAALIWKDYAEQMDMFSEGIPDSSKLIVKYEDLCQNPTDIINNIYSFLGVSKIENEVHINKETNHHIGGSPSKFEKSKTTIVHDKLYEENLTKEELDLVKRICNIPCSPYYCPEID